MTLLLLTSLGLALAQDASVEADDDEFDFLEEGDRNAERLAAEAAGDGFDVYEDEDEFEMAFEIARTRPDSYRLPVTTDGKKPLADNYPVSIVVGQMGSLVVELPVLVSAGGPAPDAPWWLVGEVWVGEAKVSETRHYVTGATLVRGGPTLAFLKLHTPVKGEEGTLQVRVSQLDAAGAATALFSRDVNWTLQ